VTPPRSIDLWDTPVTSKLFQYACLMRENGEDAEEQEVRGQLN